MHVVIIILVIFTLSLKDDQFMQHMMKMFVEFGVKKYTFDLYFPHSYFALMVQRRQNYCLVFQKCNNPSYLFICLQKLCFEFISIVLNNFS